MKKPIDSIKKGGMGTRKGRVKKEVWTLEVKIPGFQFGCPGGCGGIRALKKGSRGDKLCWDNIWFSVARL